MDLGNLFCVILNIIFFIGIMIDTGLDSAKNIRISEEERTLAWEKLWPVKIEKGINDSEIRCIKGTYKNKMVYIVLFGLFNICIEALMLDDLKWIGIIVLFNIFYAAVAIMQYNNAKNPDIYLKTTGYVLRCEIDVDTIGDSKRTHHYVYITYKTPNGKMNAKRVDVSHDEYDYYRLSRLCNVILKGNRFYCLYE